MRVLLLLTFIWFIFSGALFAQDDASVAVEYIDSLEYANKLDSLKAEFKYVLDMPPAYELALFTALSYYPELSDTRIKVKTKRIKTTLNIRPTIWSVLFNKRDKRQYILRINKYDIYGNIMLKDVRFQPAIGLFGHELAHVSDYESVGISGILKRGLWYLNENSRISYEHEIDMLTIDKGLGWQLYEWSYFVQTSPKATPKYKKLKARRYLKPKQIITNLNN